jgi:hypothetical protein
MDYENIILISHEDRSKDITRKSGDKITAIKPNLQDKVANKVAGMVDIVARVVADGDVRTLSFKTNEVIFGGCRLTVSTNEIPLDYDAFLEVYAEANRNAVAVLNGEAPQTASPAERKGRQRKTDTPAAEPEAKEGADNKESFSESAEGSTGTTSADVGTEAGTTEQPAAPTGQEGTEQKTQEQPVTRTRKKRGE